MPHRINRAIELLEAGQAIYYTGAHAGAVLTEAQGRADAETWADYINVGMEHGAFDMAGLAQYMGGLAGAGPARSGHRTPAVIVELPVNGTDETNVRHNAWQARQILGRGVHGLVLCQAESARAVRAFVEACRYPHQRHGLDPAIPEPVARLRGAAEPQARTGWLGIGRRGRGSESTAAPTWGISEDEYIVRCDPWPLNPAGELLLGVKLESPAGIARCEEILAVPGIGFAELGPGDLGLALGHVALDLYPYRDATMAEARARVFAACQRNKIAFLECATPETVARQIAEGVRVIAGGSAETARVGREVQGRAMPV